MWLGGTENVPKVIELGMRCLIKKTYLSHFVLNSKLAPPLYIIYILEVGGCALVISILLC